MFTIVSLMSQKLAMFYITDTVTMAGNLEIVPEPIDDVCTDTPKKKWTPEHLCDSLIWYFQCGKDEVAVYSHFTHAYRHYLAGEPDSPANEVDRDDMWNQLMCAAIQFGHETLLDRLVRENRFPSRQSMHGGQLQRWGKPKVNCLKYTTTLYN